MRSAVRTLTCLALATFIGALPADDTKRSAEEPKAVTTTATAVVELSGASDPVTSQAQKDAAQKGSHKESGSIKVTSADGTMQMQTMCVDGDGRVLALVAPPRGFGEPTKGATAEVHVFTPEGKPVRHWKVGFHGHSINTGPDGAVYVAGDGKVAKFTKGGEPAREVELQFIAELLKDKEGIRKAAEKQRDEQKKNFGEMVEQYEKRIKDIKDVAEEKRTKLQKRQLPEFEGMVKAYKSIEIPTVESLIKGATGRARVHNSIAVSKRDVFVVAGDTKGYGYTVWRMDHDFKNPKRVMGGLSGCCGQMDVQCCGEDILVAENCSHQFARYDRDGKKKGSWGKKTEGNDLSCFGGCCNPMNLRASKSNEVYTAESEGLIKRFSEKGEFLGVVGYAPLTGGCKNVAVGVSPDGSRVYFADQPGSRIIVLAKKPGGPKAE